MPGGHPLCKLYMFIAKILGLGSILERNPCRLQYSWCLGKLVIYFFAYLDTNYYS